MKSWFTWIGLGLKEKAFQTLPALVAAVLALLGARYGLPAPAPAPLVTPQPEAPRPADDPLKAICKLIKPGSYCSGTVVTAADASGCQRIVSAAHCHKSVGESVNVAMRDGSGCVAHVIAIDRKSDCAILRTEPLKSALPYIEISTANPAIGADVMHAGYGRHVPGNIERGKVLAIENSDGQIQYLLSVSLGDSGGGICLDSKGKLLSPVCCTTKLDALGNVWGASPSIINRMMREPTSFIDVAPMEMPIRKLPD